MSKLILLLMCSFASLTLVGCSEQFVDQPQRTEKIKIAVLKELITNNFSSMRSHASGYCIGTKSQTGYNDPEQVLLDSFATYKPILLPYSACQVDKVVHIKATGREAIFFHLSEPLCDRHLNCTIRAGYYEGNMSSQENLYNVRQINGRWVASLVSLGPVS